jgi:hypothetical protein
MSRRALIISIIGGFGLVYLFLLIVAARKGLDITNVYSLLVWLISASLIAIFCGLVSLVVVWLIGRLTVRLKTFIVVWVISIVLVGGALVATAT